MINLDRNYKIDLMKGIAILVVMLLHFQGRFNLQFSGIKIDYLKKFLLIIFNNGHYGVVVFFAISGFLITGNALKRYGDLSAVNIKHFYTLRFARIFPCLMMSLLFLVILEQIGFPLFDINLLPLLIFEIILFIIILRLKKEVYILWTAIYALIIYNFINDLHGYFKQYNINWSLVVEELFYLIFPIICILLKSKRRLLHSFLVLITMAPLFRWYLQFEGIFFGRGVISSFDIIAYGCFAAYMKDKIILKPFLSKIIMLGAIITLIATYLFGIKGNEVFGIILVSISTSLILILPHEFTIPKNLIMKGIATLICLLGRLSYELYLFNMMVVCLFYSIFSKYHLSNLGVIIIFISFFIMTLAISYFVNLFFTEPMNKYVKDKILRS